MSGLAISEHPDADKALQSKQRPRVTRKVRTAIEAMVWQGLKRAQAAQAAGLVEHSLYVAMRSPHVKAFYLQELEVLRSSERARNIHALVDVRDGTNQMARVQAVKALEQMSDDPQSSSNKQQMPGLVVQINTVSDTRLTQRPTVIIENESNST